jgi:hypothetical protein
VALSLLRVQIVVIRPLAGFDDLLEVLSRIVRMAFAIETGLPSFRLALFAALTFGV